MPLAQLVDGLPHVIHTDAGIALDHPQRFPSTHIHDGDEIDARHHAVGCPVMAPVMDGEILNSSARAGGRMLVLDRVAAGDFRLARVRIGFAKPVEEDMAICRLSSFFPYRAEHIVHARVHRHRFDHRVLAVVEPDRSFLHVHPIDAPRDLQRRLDARTLERQHRDDRLDVRGVGCDQPIAVFLAKEAHPLIVERDCLDPQGRKIVQIVVDIDRCLENRAIAVLTTRVLTTRVMASQVSAAKMLPRLLRLAQAEVADDAIQFADAQDVGRARRLGLCQIALEGMGDGALSDERSGTEHELVAQLRFMFRHQMGGRIVIGCPEAKLLDLDMLVAKRNRASDVVNAFLSTGTD